MRQRIWIFKTLEFKKFLASPNPKRGVPELCLPCGGWHSDLLPLPQESNKYPCSYEMICNKKSLSSFLGTTPQTLRILLLKHFKSRSVSSGLWRKSTGNPGFKPQFYFCPAVHKYLFLLIWLLMFLVFKTV